MIFAILLYLSASSAEPAQPIGLAEALAVAAARSPRIAVAEGGVDVAAAGARSVRSYLLPSVSLGANALWWDEASVVPYSEFLGPMTSSDACAGLEEVMQGFCEDFLAGLAEGLGEGGITLRDARTQQFTARVTQPLSGLYGIEEGWRAARALERAAHADRDRVADEVAVEVVDAWFGAARVAELERLAAQGLDALRAHEARAAAFHEAGLIGRNEVLQLQVALSEAELDLERARSGVGLTRRRLAVVTGSEARSLTPAPLDLATLPALDADPATFATRVAGLAPVRTLQAQAEAARANRNRLQAERLPQIAAIANYERNWGVGELAIPESWFLGFGAEWDVWNWGRKHYDAQQATAALRQAEAGLEALNNGLVLAAEAASEEARLAWAARTARRSSVVQAEEHLRIVKARFEAHTATATDLLEAEALRAKASADEVTAAFDYLLARARLQQALGLPIDPLGTVGEVRP